MRKSIWIILLLVLISCKNECNEEIGSIIQKEFAVTEFDKIIANTGIQLIIKESDTQQVIVETGENRFNNVYVSVSDNTLELQADAACFFNPSLAPVKVYVAVPNVQSIRNSSEFTVLSDGVLTFPTLLLISENFQSDFLNFGDFDIAIQNNKLSVVSNGLSSFNISGTTTNLYVSFYSGIGKFEGENLLADKVSIHHRGDNQMKVNPRQSLKGDLYGTGDLISFNHPPIVEIYEHFRGKLIFE
jgi:hypothetical protein